MMILEFIWFICWLICVNLLHALFSGISLRTWFTSEQFEQVQSQTKVLHLIDLQDPEEFGTVFSSIIIARREDYKWKILVKSNVKYKDKEK